MKYKTIHPASSVKIDNPQSQYSPEGMVSNITGDRIINNKTTMIMSTQNYRMGKFFQTFSKIKFEDLQEVPQANGDTVWVADTAIDNQDFNFFIKKSDILGSVTLTEVKSQQEIQEMAKKYKVDPSRTYIEIDGKKYFTRMNIPLHFGTGENNDVWINLGVFVLGESAIAGAIAAIVAKLGIDAFKEVFQHLATDLFKTLFALAKGVMTACYRFVTRFVGSLIEGEGLEAAVGAGRAAAGEAWGEAMEGITAEVLTYTVAGVIIIAILIIIIEFVLHRSYQNVYFYNLTSYDIELGFPYKYEGNKHNLPTRNVEAKVARKGPGGIDLGTWYNGVAFRYQSDSEFHGLGYTMCFKLKDPKTQEVKKTFTCMFDIPFAGDNSLAALARVPEEGYLQYYSNNEGKHKTHSQKDDDGEQEITVTYDYLSGKHKDPETDENLYLYNSLIVIKDVDA